jgi:hypothetical protein
MAGNGRYRSRQASLPGRRAGTYSFGGRRNMGVWLVTADVLAASRFVTSPLMETVNALGVLAARNPQPWERDWLARH